MSKDFSFRNCFSLMLSILGYAVMIYLIFAFQYSDEIRLIYGQF